MTSNIAKTCMKAVGISAQPSSSGVDALTDLEIAMPVPGEHDLLVQVQAVSVNPLDTKMRRARPAADGSPRILGWDAAGTVVGSGPGVTLFRPGDKVFYAGSVTRPGANAQFHLVDERIVGNMPSSLDFTQAAAFPLASLAAWEALFERMRISTTGDDAGKSLLIIGGAGGVGSVAIQLAKTVARLKVTATASRAASREWCLALGADLIADHSRDLGAELKATNIRNLDYILCLSDTDRYFSLMARLIAPAGHICALVENAAPLPMQELRSKSASFSWEGVFTRSLYGTADMVAQHRILNRVAALLDGGQLRPVAGHVLGPLCAATLREAHALVESGHSTGKVVLSGCEAGPPAG